MEKLNTLNKKLNTKDYVVIFQSGLRETLEPSLEEKQKRYYLIKRVATSFKQRLQKDVIKLLEDNNIDKGYWNPIWGAVWSYQSRHLVRKLSDLGRYISSIQFALGILDSLENPMEKGKREELDIQLAREYPVIDLISTKVRKTSNRHVAVCPFHSEDTPSFVIYSDNSWHCFGCKAHGKNAVDYLMQLENLDFLVAVRRLL